MMTIDERLERLTGIVDSLAGSVVARDDKIEARNQRLEKLLALTEESAEN